MNADDLIARYEGGVRRVSKRNELPADRWESARQRDDRGWGVGALVERAGAVLLVREGDRWFLPGGMLEAGETPHDGAVREVREETGIDIEVTGLLAVTEQTFVHAEDGRAFDFRFATFRGDPLTADTTDAPGLSGEAIEAAAWHERLPADTFDRDLVASLR